MPHPFLSPMYLATLDARDRGLPLIELGQRLHRRSQIGMRIEAYGHRSWGSFCTVASTRPIAGVRIAGLARLGDSIERTVEYPPSLWQDEGH